MHNARSLHQLICDDCGTVAMDGSPVCSECGRSLNEDRPRKRRRTGAERDPRESNRGPLDKSYEQRLEDGFSMLNWE